MALMQFLRLRRGVSEVVYTIDFKGDVSAVLAEGEGLSGGDVGRAEPMVFVQSTSVAVP